jgi:UDP-glucose 4-epimerase
MEPIIITGCSGFIGSNLLKAFNDDFKQYGIDIADKKSIHRHDEIYNWNQLDILPTGNIIIQLTGKALIELRKIDTDEVLSFALDGENTSFVDMPIWHTHNIKNIGTEELYTFFWINELFDPNDPDTYYEKV